MRDVDVIVIGSGQGGVPLATTLAGEGRHVVLFERGRFGGCCINVGCTPSKAFLAGAHSVGRARRAHAVGLRGEVHLDFPAAMERVRSFTDDWSAAVRTRLERAGVEIIAAEAAFSAPGEVQGGDEQLRAPLIAIDTGGSAFVPPLPGLDGVAYLDNASFFAQRELPARLLVLGGGYIGLELGQGMTRAGSAVTIVEEGTRVLEREEPESSAVLAAALIEDGVHLRLGVRATAVSRRGQTIALGLSDGTSLEGDALLVAVGRRPATAALQLERAGIVCDDHGFIKVDARLQTSCAGVYALGDVAGQPQFTHVSWEDHRRILDELRGTPRTRDDRTLAYTTFTEPQVARAGLTLDEARRSGLHATAVTLPLSEVARAVEWNEERGFFRMVVDDDDDRILGATFVGYECGELIHVMIALIDSRATWQQLARAMYVHPTLAEGLPALARLVPAARAGTR